MSEAVRLMSGTVAVRARLRPRPEPPLDLFYDPLLDDLTRRGEVARQRFPVHWGDAAALRALGEAKRAPLEPGLADAMREQHRRLGASAESLRALERLASGQAVCAVAGQQPAPLGGPLFSLHKIASTVGLAASFEARTGIPCVPLFWMHGEDSDFAEIRGATVAGAGLTLCQFELPSGVHREGGLVGNLPLEPLAALERDALACWQGLAGAADVAGVLDGARSAARDFGEASVALWLRLFARAGIVVVDPRLPAFRAAARPIVDRYLANADALSAAARHAGEGLERLGLRRALNDAALESFVFAIDDGVRRKIGATEARARDASRPLSPSVALRPAVQDGVLPTVAMACGPGEVAYLAQLREVFEGLDVRQACPVPRLSMTWLPPSAVTLLEEAGVDAAALIAGADSVLRVFAERRVPDAARRALERARDDSQRTIAELSDAVREVDPSLPQMVESARGKVDFQFARVAEGVTAKVRQKLERQHPEWPRLRYVLMPGEKTQERRLASLEPVARRGLGAIDAVVGWASEGAERLASGVAEHLVVEW